VQPRANLGLPQSGSAGLAHPPSASPALDSVAGATNRRSPEPSKTIHDSIRSALTQGGIIDITTTGRRSGQPRRIEIVYHVIDGRFYIGGMPNPDRTRRWLSNLEADPKFTFHLKNRVSADLPATARVITDEVERRTVLEHIARAWNRTDLDAMVADSPLVEVTIDGLGDPPSVS
jgi:deazaflavin-dependent oxidoreductase (nitroreductase family)